MLDLLAGFVGELRAAGLPVSLTENIDAMEAVRHVPLDDREALRTAMATTMVKRPEHRPAFDAVFDTFFSLGAVGVEGAEDADLAALLDEALRSGDEEAVRRLARLAVAR